MQLHVFKQVQFWKVLTYFTFIYTNMFECAALESMVGVKNIVKEK